MQRRPSAFFVRRRSPHPKEHTHNTNNSFRRAHLVPFLQLQLNFVQHFANDVRSMDYFNRDDDDHETTRDALLGGGYQTAPKDDDDYEDYKQEFNDDDNNNSNDNDELLLQPPSSDSKFADLQQTDDNDWFGNSKNEDEDDDRLQYAANKPLGYDSNDDEDDGVMDGRFGGSDGEDDSVLLMDSEYDDEDDGGGDTFTGDDDYTEHTPFFEPNLPQLEAFAVPNVESSNSGDAALVQRRHGLGANGHAGDDSGMTAFAGIFVLGVAAWRLASRTSNHPTKRISKSKSIRSV